MSKEITNVTSVKEAVVLAGGQGTRLSSVIRGTQKVVAPVCGEPFLSRVLRKMHVEGVERVILALGYRADDVMLAIEPHLPTGLIIIPSIENSPLGTGGAIRHALPLIQSSTVLIMNGDSLVDYSLVDLVSFHQDKQACVTMVLCNVSDVSRYGSVTIDQLSRVVNFQEKLGTEKVPGIINAGIYLMSRDTIAEMPYMKHSLEHTLLPKVCGAGLYGLMIDAPFIDIGTPADYATANDFFVLTENKL